MMLRDVSDMWRTLMVDDLGFPSFFAQGGDQGSIVSTWLAFDHPERAGRCTWNSDLFLPARPRGADRRGARLGGGERRLAAARGRLPHPTGHPTHDARLRPDRLPRRARRLDRGEVQGLDRPGGRTVDPPFSMDALLTDVMLYWLGGANPASWYYVSFYEGHNQLPEGGRVEVPTGFLLTPRDVSLFPPSSVLERAYNVVHRRHAVDGGHFLAFEQPALYFFDDVRAFFRPFRRPLRA